MARKNKIIENERSKLVDKLVRTSLKSMDLDFVMAALDGDVHYTVAQHVQEAGFDEYYDILDEVEREVKARIETALKGIKF